MNEDLRNWFRDKWVRMNTKGDIVGDCARDEGEGKPKCLPLAKARAMSKDDRASAAMRKRREDPVADRAGKGNKPINVATEEVSTSELIKKSHSKRGAPGTLKAKIKGPLTLEKVRSLKNRANATTLDKKQANFYINMQSEEYLEEKNVPTNPALWARAKTLARSKFDVYPSAYANGWAAKWYKGKGGSWKSVQEGRKMKTLKDILSEGVTVTSDFKLVNSVNTEGRPVTRKVRAHRKTMNPQKNESEEKPDVLTSIQKFVGRQYDEEVTDVATTYKKLAIKHLKDSMAKDATNANKTYAKKMNQRALEAAKMSNHKDALNHYRGIKEEVEQIDELKKSTLGSYIKKAARDKSNIDSSIGDDDQWENMSDKEQQKSLRQSLMRKKGIDKATDKLTKEEFEQIDEISKELTHSYFVKSVNDKSKEKRQQRMSGQGRAIKRLTNKITLPDQVAKDYANHKPGQYVGDSYEPEGDMVEAQSASMRMFKALQKIKQQRETEEARKKENEKRALEPKKQGMAEGLGKDIKRLATGKDVKSRAGQEIAKSQDASMKGDTKTSKKHFDRYDKLDKLANKEQGVAEAKDPREYDYEGDMAKTQLRSIIANSQAVHDMLKDTTNISEWVQSKITKAEDYISTVADYMTAEMNEQYVGSADSKDMQKAVDKARMIAKSSMLKGIYGDNYQDKQDPDHDESDVKVSPNDKGGYSASLKLTPKAKPQAAATNEAKEDDDEDYTKHHKLDPDSGVEADQHIHVQLKKAIDSTMKPYEVTFKNGKKHSVSSPVAKTIVTAVEKLKPEHRKAVHDELHKSYDSLMGVHKMITGK
jgi:hypothetical protein